MVGVFRRLRVSRSRLKDAVLAFVGRLELLGVRLEVGTHRGPEQVVTLRLQSWPGLCIAHPYTFVTTTRTHPAASPNDIACLAKRNCASTHGRTPPDICVSLPSYLEWQTTAGNSPPKTIVSRNKTRSCSAQKQKHKTIMRNLAYTYSGCGQACRRMSSAHNCTATTTHDDNTRHAALQTRPLRPLPLTCCPTITSACNRATPSYP